MKTSDTIFISTHLCYEALLSISKSLSLHSVSRSESPNSLNTFAINRRQFLQQMSSVEIVVNREYAALMSPLILSVAASERR